MPFPKDWKRYNPNLETLIRAWERKGYLLEIPYDSAKMVYKIRSELYAFHRALGRAPKADEAAKEIWEISRKLSLRVRTPEGGRVDFAKGYDGPAVLVMCQAEHGQYGNPVDQALFHLGLKSTEDELDAERLMERMAAASAPEAQCLEPAQCLSPAQCLGQGLVQCLSPAPVPAPVPPMLAPVGLPMPAMEGSPPTTQEIARAIDNPYTKEMFDLIHSRSPDSAIRLAQAQAMAYSPGEWQRDSAISWLERMASSTKT